MYSKNFKSSVTFFIIKLYLLIVIKANLVHIEKGKSLIRFKYLNFSYRVNILTIYKPIERI